MLNVGQLNEGVVLDHIEAGKSMSIYHYLKLDQLDCCVAIIKNARSNKMGKKDIIKVECPVDMLDLDILGFIDHNITAVSYTHLEHIQIVINKVRQNIVKRSAGMWRFKTDADLLRIFLINSLICHNDKSRRICLVAVNIFF